MGKSGGMARFFWTTMVVAVVVYIVFAVIMLVYLPRKIEMAESRLPGIQQAIAECAADQTVLLRNVYDKLNIWPLPALRKLFFDGSQPL